MIGLPVAMCDALAQFSGDRALILDGGVSDAASVVRRQFAEVECHSLGSGTKGATWKALPFDAPDGQFDAVFLFRVRKHVLDEHLLIAESMRVLRQRGVLVSLESAGNDLSPAEKVFLDVERFLAREPPSAQAGQPSDVTDMLRAAGLHHWRMREIEDEIGLPSDASRRKQEVLACIGESLLSDSTEEREKTARDLIARVAQDGIRWPRMILIHGIKKATGESLGAALDGITQDSLSDEAVDDARISGLASSELLSLILGEGQSVARHAKLGRRVLQEYGSRALADERDPRTLARVYDMGLARARQIVAAFELGRRFFGRSRDDARFIRGPEDIIRELSHLTDASAEELHVLCVGAEHELLAVERLATGSTAVIAVTASAAFAPALRCKAKALVLVHNHPSGSAEPSPEDVEMTRQLQRAGREIGLEVLDHVIVARDSWFSLRMAGLL